MKKQKEADQLQKNLKKGDRVLTQAGFFAEVERVQENGNVVLRLSEGVKLEFQRQAIVSKVQEG
jgi:preprotein translocase YajC subunit